MMKSRRQKVLEDCLTINRHNTNGGENLEPIPIDLIIEILLKLPAKSIAKCRCVSKLWASILRRSDFTELFLTRSLARPQLLFAFQILSELFFFSTPQPQNPDENSCPVVASYHMKVPCFPYEDISLIRGLVCLYEERILNGRKNPVIVSVIFNPSTGQSLTLPKMKTTKRVGLMSYFGYDPIGQQYKVLSTITSPYRRDDGNRQYQILTLGTGELSWRMIDPCRPHVISYGNKICINGVLYYRAGIGRMSSETTMLVRFDFSSEKFFFMEIMESFSRPLHTAATLINYNGKLGSLLSVGPRFVTGGTISFELWVLEDFEKHEWSKHTYILPPLWKHMVGDVRLNFVGVTRTNEIMLSPDMLDTPFVTPFVYVFYYNMERQTITRVQIEGMEKLQGIIRVNTFLDHVENVKLLQSF